MAYVAPTVVDFVKRFPRFFEIDATVIQSALSEAARRVDDGWTEGDFALGRMLYAAHVLTLDGLGGGAEAEAASAGALGFQSMSSGSLSLTRYGSASGGAGLDATSYGRRFMELARLNIPAVAVANGPA